jgi:hypothetical protein
MDEKLMNKLDQPAMPLPEDLICVNCGRRCGDHAWISRKCNNGGTYEKLIPYKDYSRPCAEHPFEIGEGEGNNG